MFFKRLWPALLWALFILILCGIPGQKIPRMDFLSWLKPDKMVHLFLFGVLSYLLIKGFTGQIAIVFLKSNPKLSAVLLTISYGIVIEVLQETIFINRSGDVRDAMADTVGAVIGWWVFNYLAKKKAAQNQASG